MVRLLCEPSSSLHTQVCRADQFIACYTCCSGEQNIAHILVGPTSSLQLMARHNQEKHSQSQATIVVTQVTANDADHAAEVL